MSRLLLCGFIALTLLCGCATSSRNTFNEGNYRLISLGENARTMEITVVLKLSESSLAIAGTKNSWFAPISKNTIGALTPVKRTESAKIGAIESMFLNTIEGAQIATMPDGLLTFNRNDRVVALFEPIQ